MLFVSNSFFLGKFDPACRVPIRSRTHTHREQLNPTNLCLLVYEEILILQNSARFPDQLWNTDKVQLTKFNSISDAIQLRKFWVRERERGPGESGVRSEEGVSRREAGADCLGSSQSFPHWSNCFPLLQVQRVVVVLWWEFECESFLYL